ncbi:hypothetical protein D1BOALGB6SA_5157 [Olavius sp. associated proteobacterium Delta 1]|nr:hypothetical protein D1BOALGB6SA_5157 [Olavius sp. associated proteobacterium Delta 1]
MGERHPNLPLKISSSRLAGDGLSRVEAAPIADQLNDQQFVF